MLGPSPDTRHPLPGAERVAFLKPIITHPQIIVGDYTYYDDPDDPGGFERNVHYLFDFTGDRLIIGKFCQIATGASFIMNGANHRMEGFSIYPFFVFGQGWAGRFPEEAEAPMKGDTRIGNDVWLGRECLILPGVQVGDGAIIAARSVVASDVPPYTIAAGNPARPIRQRFDAATIDALLTIRWWDWDAARITRHIPAICGGDIAALQAAARESA